MRTQPVSAGTQSFGNFKTGNDALSKEVYSRVKSLPVVKKFGKDFDGIIGLTYYQSRKNPVNPNYALEIIDLKPKSILQKIKNLFIKNPVESIQLRTHANSMDEFVSELANVKPDTLNKIYNKIGNNTFNV